jgi:pimeloyl-ACP methyl ester carboxylesterase
LETFPYFETFTLRWESKALFDLGSSVMEIVASLGQQAALEVLTLTAAATLISALAWPITLLQAADMIDSTWTICCEKADRAGQLLAQVLMKKEHGHRPVVLVGYSMGARVIMSCLLELAKVQKAWENEQLRNNHGRRRGSSVGGTPAGATASAADLGSPASGLVHTVVMLGAPVSSRDADWRKARGIVADRLVNCYSKKDWVLSLMYRYQKLTLNAAGIAPVKTAGVENVDVTEVVTGHQFYSSKIMECLLLVGLDDCFAASAAGMDGRFRRREADTEIATATNGGGGEEEEEEGIMGDDDDDEDEGGGHGGGGGGGGGRRERGDPPIILY